MGSLLSVGAEAAEVDATAKSLEEQPSPFGRFSYFVAGGVGLPAFDTADAFERGFGLSLGLGYRLRDWLGVRGDFLLISQAVRSDLLADAPEGILGGHRMQAGTLAARVELLPRTSALNVSLLGGGGVYWRRVSIEEITGVQIVTACSPGAFFCFPTPTPTTEVLGKRSSLDVGLNAGVNFGVSLGYPTRIFVEPRFHFLFGPMIDTPTGPKRALGYYVPIMLGFNYL